MTESYQNYPHDCKTDGCSQVEVPMERLSVPDPNEWECGDCGAPVKGSFDWCPECDDDALHAAKTREDMVRLKQIGGNHYNKRAIQPWDIIDEYGMNYYAGSVLKYLLRYPDKNGVEDLKKAQHCIEKLISLVEKDFAE